MRDEQRLLAALHADKVNAELVDNGGLRAGIGREAGYLGCRVAGQRLVFHELRVASAFAEVVKACLVVCQNQEPEGVAGPVVDGHSRRLTFRLLDLARIVLVGSSCLLLPPLAWLLRLLHVLQGCREGILLVELHRRAALLPAAGPH